MLRHVVCLPLLSNLSLPGYGVVAQRGSGGSAVVFPVQPLINYRVMDLLLFFYLLFMSTFYCYVLLRRYELLYYNGLFILQDD